MGNKWTKQQQAVIDNRGSNLLVSAAAGSGKTAVLIERIIRLILDKENPIDIDRLLVVTFTKAAASEMKERVSLAIERELEKNPDDEHLQRQMNLLPMADISTISSFCGNVVKNNFHLTDLEPNVSVADPTEVELVASEVIDELFEELYENDDEKFLMLVDWYAERNKDSGLSNIILSINKFIGSSPYPDLWLENSAEMFNNEKVSDEKLIDDYLYEIAVDVRISLLYEMIYLIDVVRQIDEYDGLNKFRNYITGPLDVAIKVCELIYIFIDVPSADNWEYIRKEAFVFLNSKRDRRSGSNKEPAKSFYNEKKDDVKDSVDAIVKELKRLMVGLSMLRKENDILYPYMKALSDLTMMFREKFSQKKRKLGVVDFSDIEHYALNILTKVENDIILPSDVALSYRDRYEEVFIDEYQDSNNVQEYILSTISREDRPNRFMVGDVKQSIYRFRQAKPEIFMKKYEEYDLREIFFENTSEVGDRSHSKDKKILLYKNFRSRSQILEGCNHIFGQIMRRDTAELDYTDEERLNPGAIFEKYTGEDGFVGGPIEVYLVDEIDDDKSEKMDDIYTGVEDKGEVRDDFESTRNFPRECMKIGEIIHNLVRGGNDKDRFKVFDNQIGGYRNVEFKDIVILMRAPNQRASILEDVLSQIDIPVYSDSGGDYFATYEIDVVMNLLKVIDNPVQDIPLVSVMRSPIFGFTSKELASIRLVDNKVSFYESVLKIYNCKDFLDTDGGDAKDIVKATDIREATDTKEATDIGEVTNVGEDANFGDVADIREDTDINYKYVNDTLINKVVNMIDTIKDFSDKSKLMSIDEFIWHILKKTGYYTYVGMLEMGEQRQNNLMLLFERARNYEKTSYKGLFNFIDYVERIKAIDGFSSVDIGEAKSITEDANVVRVMSIHKSKGLEFPVVIVANTSKKFYITPDNPKLSLHQEKGYGPQIIDLEKKILYKSMAKEKIERTYYYEQIAEEMRLFYVAMTRAKEKLIFTGMLRDIDFWIRIWSNIRRDEDGNISTRAIVSSKNYLEWIMPTIINLSRKGKFTNVYGNTEYYTGYKDCNWYIDVENGVDLYNNFNRLSEKEFRIDNEESNVDLDSKKELQTGYSDIDEKENIKSCEEEKVKSCEENATDESSLAAKVIDDALVCKNYLNDEVYEAIKSKFEKGYTFKSSASKPSSISVSEVKKMLSEDDELHDNMYSRNVVSNLKVPNFKHDGDEKMEFNAAERGTIFHLVMQLFDFQKISENMSNVNNELKRQIEDFVDRDLISVEESKTINLLWIERFVKSDIFGKIVASSKNKTLYKEKAINYSIKINEIYKNEEIPDSERLMLVGIIDLFFEDENGDIVLLDYKTDFVNDENIEEVVSRYDIQLDLYKNALEEISGRKVSKKYIYLFSVGKLYEYK